MVKIHNSLTQCQNAVKRYNKAYTQAYNNEKVKGTAANLSHTVFHQAALIHAKKFAGFWGSFNYNQKNTELRAQNITLHIESLVNLAFKEGFTLDRVVGKLINKNKKDTNFPNYQFTYTRLSQTHTYVCSILKASIYFELDLYKESDLFKTPLSVDKISSQGSVPKKRQSDDPSQPPNAIIKKKRHRAQTRSKVDCSQSNVKNQAPLEEQSTKTALNEKHKIPKKKPTNNRSCLDDLRPSSPQDEQHLQSHQEAGYATTDNSDSSDNESPTGSVKNNFLHSTKMETPAEITKMFNGSYTKWQIHATYGKIKPFLNNVDELNKVYAQHLVHAKN